MKSTINHILSKFGLILVKKDNWRPKLKSEELIIPQDIKEIIHAHSMLNDYRLVNIVNSINYLISNKIEGSLVECGVWKGGSVALMAHQLKAKQSLRDLHLFDVFDDICQPDAAIDGERAIKDVGGIENAQGELKSIAGVYNQLGGKGNDEAVMDLLVQQLKYPKGKVYLHKGWFQDTLPLVHENIGKIALLRLDGDWYASTKVCLDYLYQYVVKGGIIIIDDYGCYEGCKKAVDEFLVNNQIIAYKISIDEECIYWVKQ